jgi:hypothetical protein
MKKPVSDLNRNVHATLIEMLQADPTADQLNLALRMLAKWRAKLIENTIVQKNGRTIKHGPFQGMDYGVPASEGGGAPRLLGVYETTLAPIMDEIIASDPDVIIDIGSAEGYYAVGLARRLHRATVWARDASAIARRKCRKLAQLNGVEDRVEIGGEMTHADFDICLRHRTVVICDIEGDEVILLDPNAAPGLYAADILVECHPNHDKSCVATLMARFADTHQIIELGRDLDTAGLPKWMDGSSDLDRLIALWEWRSTPTPWLWMTAKPAHQ